MTIKIKKYLRIGRELLCSLLFPRRCPVCDEILEPEVIEKGIHSACENKLYPIIGAVCMHCGRPVGNQNPQSNKTKYDMEYISNTREYCYDCVQQKYDKQSFVVQAKSLYIYKGDAKKMMYRFKYSNKREYAVFFAQRAVQQYLEWIKRIGVEAIVPVPMYRKKQKKRGYNQAESFACELSRLTGIPMCKDWIYRAVDTVPQKGLDALQRKNNLKKAFICRKNVVQYSCVMVVDDIYTTGSTAEAVAQELIKQGTRSVYLMTVCVGEDM